MRSRPRTRLWSLTPRCSGRASCDLGCACRTATAVARHSAVRVRAVKALRFAPPALRAAGGLDRAIREPSVCSCRRPQNTLLTLGIDGVILEFSSTVARFAQPLPHRPMRGARIGGLRSRFVLSFRNTSGWPIARRDVRGSGRSIRIGGVTSGRCARSVATIRQDLEVRRAIQRQQWPRRFA